ncbi:Phox/Bem1p [Macleaya cordata]|uniref:Phox/Bem1p n=1 Tax=Macleaya cordata TaxID=56857 RepID=A0A200RD61_MACCD|nr:Phox/Bem1p [Macleaya cordata]
MVRTSQKSNGVTVRSKNGTETVKFLYSYSGKILPRYPDGKLRYVGGETRVLAVDRSISFSELLVKLAELCGSSVSLRCQLPTEDLDALISVTSDEDLANVIEEYDIASKGKPNPLKIKAFLYPPKSTKKISPPPSSASSSTTGSPPAKYSPPAVGSGTSFYPGMAANRCVHHISTPIGFPVCYEKSAPTQPRYYACIPHQASPRNVYLVHNGNHWQ